MQMCQQEDRHERAKLCITSGHESWIEFVSGLLLSSLDFARYKKIVEKW